MKTDRLNKIVDNIILVILLFVPFVICLIIDAMHALILKIKGTAKSKAE